MEELLREVALSERRKRQMDSFIETITQQLQSVPHSPEVEVCRTCVTYRAIKIFCSFGSLRMYSHENIKTHHLLSFIR